jgi:DNA helicase-2/ATP-dependent DNA helicase PcrA
MSPGLNPEQKKAVECIHGPLLVFAGAGSGKTRVITHRIANMIANGIPSSSIVAVTFTNKSAKEMKERLSKMLDRKRMRGLIVSTFHSLGNKILRAEIDHLPGYRDPFSIITPDDAAQFLTDIYRKLKLDPQDVKKDGILFKISLCKNSGLTPDEYAERELNSFDAGMFLEIYRQYHERLVDFNSVDFDDLIILPQRILRENPEVLKKYRSRHRYYLVDEFQDTNPTQYDLLRMLVGEDKNICAVGDDDQSIYGWRGADINIILGFQKDFPETKSTRLEWNYRSTATILHAANKVISNNTARVAKTLKSVGGPGEKITLMQAQNEVHEAELIADTIQREMVKNGRKPGDFAVLFRTNFQSRVFEQEFRRRSIPHHVVGGYRFFDRREVRDLIAYLRVIANPKDEIAIKRIINSPKRGIGENTIKKINEYIVTFDAEHQPDFNEVMLRMMETPGLLPGVKSDTVASMRGFLELLEKYRRDFAKADRLTPVFSALVRDLNFEAEFMREGDNENAVKARMLNLSEMVNMLSYMESDWDETAPPTLYDFLARIGLQASDMDDDNPRGRVQLLTMHVSKGLEFPVVFLAGMEDGLFPSERSIDESTDSERALAEERRLFYVGITRAMKKLYLTASAERRKFGESFSVELSRFLDELPEECIEWEYMANELAKIDPETRKEIARNDLLDGLKMLGG